MTADRDIPGPSTSGNTPARPPADPPKPGAVHPDTVAHNAADAQAGAEWKGAEATLANLTGAPARPAAPEGQEQTVAASPPATPVSVAATAKPVAPAAEWKGDDATMVPVAKPTAGDAASDWKGDDVTMAGMAQAPGDAATAGQRSADGDSWAGLERTVAGISAPVAGQAQGLAPAPPSAESGTGTGTGSRAGASEGSGTDNRRSGEARTPSSRTRTGSRIATKNTSISFDDAWHMEGRHGPHTGQSWGDWDLGGILGEGGMGAVYRAKQNSLKRRVAIKVLSPALAADFKLLQRFQLEARMTSMLSSPNLVQVFAAGEWEQNHFFVMEYIDGTDLYQVIKERQQAGKPFTPDEAADVILQAAKGLIEAGRYGMVHRDIKPANLMVTRQGLVKVADFGIVKVMGEASLTMTGQAVGTPSYVSPEQGRGQVDIDQRADFYSLGVVFYELLCGKKPFEATSPNALIYQHCYAEPELPRTLNPAISEAYQAVVLKCLQKKPENRYQTAEELTKDLDGIRTGNLLQSALVNYRQGTGAEEAQRENLSWAQRNLLPLVAGMIVLLVLIGLAGFAYIRHYQERRLQANELYHELSALDSPQPIPRGADQDLERYAVLPGVDQAKIASWRNKLQQVAALRASLGRLDADKVASDIRQSATEDLRNYQELVGVQEPQGIDWRRKLERLQMSEGELRDSLRLLDQKTDLSDVEYQAMSPKVEELANITGADDPQVVRCRKRLSDYDQLKQSSMARLAMLDKPDVVVSDQQRLRLQGDLSTLELMLGKQDDNVQRWARRLISSSEQVSKLRQRLRRLDHVELPPVSMQRDLDKDLAAIQALIDKDDPELRGWLAKIAAASAEIESLRKRLAGIDAMQDMRPSQISDTAAWLSSLATLAGESDPDFMRWNAKVHASQQHLVELKATLNRLQQPEEMTVDEQHRVALAVTQLEALGALSAETRDVALRRLARDQQLLGDRHRRLQAFDRNAGITSTMRSDLTMYLRQESIDDIDAKRWSAKLSAVDSIYADLASLDHASPIVADAQQRIDHLAGLVGNDEPAVVRWRAKIALVGKLRQELSVLDAIKPLPAHADDSLMQLAAAIGGDGADYQRWRAKATEVISLRQQLASLPTTAVLSVDAGRMMRERCDRLVVLVGSSDPDLVAWHQRLAELAGPGQPAWASRYVHDQFGPLASATLLGVPVRFRFVPSGQFLMGSPESEEGRDADERQVPVTLSQGFWLAESECTQELYYAVMHTNPSRDQGKDFPVERVSWTDCARFLSELSRQVGNGFSARFPTEAEWEFACRAGTPSSYVCSRSDQTDPRRIAEEVAWFADNANDKSHQVKQRVPNPLGLYDIQGNVAEWCEDHYSPYPTVAAVDPRGVDGELRVVRGGSWGDPMSSLRAANRIPARQELRSAYLGLRIAVDLDAAGGTSSLAVFSASSSEASASAGPTHPVAVSPAATVKPTHPAVSATAAGASTAIPAAGAPGPVVTGAVQVPHAVPAASTGMVKPRANGHGFPRASATTVPAVIRSAPAVAPASVAAPARTQAQASVHGPLAPTPPAPATGTPPRPSVKPSAAPPVHPAPVPPPAPHATSSRPPTLAAPHAPVAGPAAVVAGHPSVQRTVAPHHRPVGTTGAHWREMGTINAGF